MSAADVATLMHSRVLPGRLVRLGAADVKAGRIAFEDRPWRRGRTMMAGARQRAFVATARALGLAARNRRRIEGTLRGALSRAPVPPGTGRSVKLEPGAL